MASVPFRFAIWRARALEGSASWRGGGGRRQARPHGNGRNNDSGGEAGDLTAGVTARQGWMAVIPCVRGEGASAPHVRTELSNSE